MDNTIYISGKITGTTDYVERFDKAELTLWRRGWKNIINPVVVTSKLPEETTWEQYMRKCIQELMGADFIYMLDGWESSRGARIEYRIAKELGICPLYEMKKSENNRRMSDEQ